MELRKFVTTSTLLYGYSPVPPAKIAAHLCSTSGLSGIAGDFVVVLEGEFIGTGPGIKGTVIASAGAGTVPYYYRTGKIFGHGPTIGEACGSIGHQERSRNVRGLAALALFGHTTNGDTLIGEVKRLRPFTVVVHANGETKVSSYLHTVVRSEFILGEVLEEQDQLLKSYLEAAGSRPALSLTAGLSSRVLLSAALHYGYKPVVYTWGREGSKDEEDVQVARQICRDFFLEHRYVALSEKEINDEALARGLSEWSGGELNENFLLHAAFIKKAELGAFTGFLSAVNADCICRRSAGEGWQDWYGRVRGSAYVIRQRIRKRLPVLSKDLLSGAAELEQLLMKEASEADRRRWLSGLEYFHLRHRVSHEFGLLLGLYRREVRVLSPFTDLGFTGLVDQLPPRFKGSGDFRRMMVRYFFPGMGGY